MLQPNQTTLCFYSLYYTSYIFMLILLVYNTLVGFQEAHR